jgi:hypothetical protein
MREDHKVRIATREKLMKDQNGLCSYCNKPIKGKASLDHIVPIILCTSGDIELIRNVNLTATCIPCNKRKGDRIIFSNLFDKVIYPMIEIPYFYHYNYIIYNHKDRRSK